MIRPLILKLGGELLEDAPAIRRAAAAIVHLAARGPLVVVHGGGRAIDAELRARGIAPAFVDGLRITDAASLDVVVGVLAGRTNTALVAAIGAAGGRAVGLTGADGFIGLAAKTPPVAAVSGERVDLGLVGHPVGRDAQLVESLIVLGHIPVVSSIGMDERGELLNVNADTFAAHLAAVLGARALIIAGTTAGVLDDEGQTLEEIDEHAIEAMAASGAAHSGMIAKLRACRHALANGVPHVAVVNGRSSDFELAPGTRIVARAGRNIQEAGVNA